LQWFDQRMGANGLPVELEGWNFVDWVESDGWDSGVPPLQDNRNSSIIGLQYVYTIQKAVELMEALNMNTHAVIWKERAEQIKKSVMNQCWNVKKGMLSDTPEMKYYSQHANILAVLTDAIPLDQQQVVMNKIIDNKAIAQASYYFRFYLSEALNHSGLGDMYLQSLTPWEKMLQEGLTTFKETDEKSRSDCHAWSASPLYHFYSIVVGIVPSSAGFKTVQIAPNLGDLEWVKATIPHPRGELLVDLKQSKNKVISGEIILPTGLTGEFIWKGKTILLKGGKNIIE